MAKQTGERDKALKPVLVSGIVVLVVCILVCVFYVVDLQKRYKTEAKNNLLQHMDVAGNTILQQAELMQQDMEEAAQKLEAVGQTADAGEIEEILAEYQYSENLEEIAYIEQDGGSYFGTQQQTSLTEAQIAKFMSDKAMTSVINKYLDDEMDGAVLVSAPVHANGEAMTGVLIAVKSFRSMLDTPAFEHLREVGQLYLIDAEGTIYSKALTDERQKSSKETHFFVRLRTIAKGSTWNRQRIERLKSGMPDIAESGEGTLSAVDGSVLYILFEKLDIGNGLFLAECFSEDVLLEGFSPIILRSVLAFGLILLIMSALVINMWYYMKAGSDEMRKLAYMDAITHGMNFNYFLEKSILIIKNNQEIPYLLQRFDISNFRYINEAYGHDKADQLLTIVIEEGGKTFGNKELCVRMNADQFVVLAQNGNDYQTRFAVFEDNINIRALDIGIKFPIRFKSGIYQIRRDDYDINVMVDHANVARKSLKADSKEWFAYYSDRIVDNMRKVEKIESEQQNALINGEFKVYLQPKWDIKKDELYGAEALVRWIKDDGDMVYPDSFIPVFENNGFIEQLDFFMLESVCAEIRKLIDEGKKAFPISVNQSRRLWDNPEYVANVGRVLKKYDVPSRYIDLEVTETVFFGEREKMIEIINQLKQKDVLLSMDDFGSGYSSLNLLKDIPFDILKIDKDFFSESVTSQSNTWILKKIIEMAEGLGMHVLCEGVENKEQIYLLKDIGCHYVQGYFYSKPIPLDDFIEKYVS